MGLVLDTCILIHAERHGALDFSPWASHGDAFISAITVSELLVGVHRADSDARRARRSAFVEAILAQLPALDFTTETARVHAGLFATLSQQGQMIGAHDLDLFIIEDDPRKVVRKVVEFHQKVSTEAQYAPSLPA